MVTAAPLPSSPSLVLKTWSSIAPLLTAALAEGRCHQWVPGSSWIACALLCCPPNRYWGAWRPPWGQGLVILRLLHLWRPHLLNLPDWGSLYQVLIPAQEELHSLQLAIVLQSSMVASSLLPVHPKEPMSFHSNIPTIVSISPHLRANNTPTMLVSTGL